MIDPATALRVPTGLAVPGPLALRRRMRRAQRRHGESKAGDLYMIVLLIAVYGAAFARGASRYVDRGGVLSDAHAANWWLAAAGTLALAGLAWRALRLVGPLLATPAAQAWCLATPVDRRGWLSAPLTGLLLAGALGGAGLAVAAGLLAGLSGYLALLVTGAGAGAAVISCGVLLQSWQQSRLRPIEWAPAAIGFAGAAVVLALHARAVSLPVPAVPGRWVALGMVLVAAVLVTSAVLGLRRVDRMALGTGAPVAGAAASAAMFMDPDLLFGVLETRRWRAVGRVRRWRWWPGGRSWLLLQADLRRQLRRPGGLAVWAGLLVIPYALAVLAPPLAGPGRLLAGYLAGNRLAAGLRTVRESPALRRVLGGTDLDLSLIHLAVPALGLAVWWSLSAAVHQAPGYPVQVIFPLGLLGAVYRSASRPPRSYDRAVVETPFGLIPLGLLRQLVRGIDVVALLLLVELFLGRVH
jgi:hypothetical protein